MPMGGELGIRTGERWAYRPGTTHPLQQALILSPGQHYNADIRIRLLDDPAVTEIWTTRAKLPCKWAEVEIYLRDHPDVPRGYPPTPEPPDLPDAADQQMAFTANELRAIIHDEVVNAFGAQKIAYTMREAAIATGISTTLIRAAVRNNYLTANYAGSKPLFTPAELQRWVESLPEQPWRITYR